MKELSTANLSSSKRSDKKLHSKNAQYWRRLVTQFLLSLGWNGNWQCIYEFMHLSQIADLRQLQLHFLCGKFKGTLQGLTNKKKAKREFQKQFPLPGLEPGSLG